MKSRRSPGRARLTLALTVVLAALPLARSLASDDKRPTTAPAAQPARQERAPAPAAIAPVVAEQRAYAVVRARMTALKACYLTGARGGASVSGKAVVSFAVMPSGRATDIRVDAPALEGTGVAACVSAAVSHWHFGRDAAATVSFPLLFVQG
jgi:hypothetical protein